MAASQSAFQIPSLSRNDTSDFDYDCTDEADEHGISDARNLKLQEHFAKKMRPIAKSRSHRRVSVLLLSWAKEGDDYLDVGEEIKDLKDVFENIYHFRVTEAQLRSGREDRGAPTDQLNYHLAAFILNERKGDCLLIVYYAGHGLRKLKTQDLELLGGNPDDEKSLTRVVWSRAEELLHQTKADKLVIFDCCYAGILAQEHRSPFSKHIFEIIAATRAHKTAVGPGDDSFTRALIWALKRLAERNEAFTTTTLMKSIENAPNFAKDQAPICSERGKKQSIYKLILTPLPSEADVQPPKGSDPVDQEGEAPVQFYLHLTCLFGEWPRRKHIDRLTDSLCAAGKQIPLKQVLWKGLSDKDHKMSLEEAASMVFAKTRRKLSGKRHELLRLQPSTVVIESGEHSADSIDAQQSDSTLVGTVIASPIPLDVPQAAVDSTGIYAETVHADIHATTVHADNIKADVQNHFLVAGWQRTVPTLLFGILLGVSMAYSRDLVRFKGRR